MTLQRHLGALIAGAMQSRRRAGAGSAPTFSSVPVLLGTPTVGVPVAFLSGTVNGSPTPTLQQQWLLNGANIPGATNLTYTPILADAGKALSVRQSATNGISPAANAQSASAIVQAAQTPIQVNLPSPEYFDTTPVFVDMVTQGFGFMVPGSGTTVVQVGADGYPAVANFEAVTQIRRPTTGSGSITFELSGELGTGVTYGMRSAQTGDVLGSPTWNPTTKKTTISISYASGRPKATFCLVVTGAKRLDLTPGVNAVRCARDGYTIADLDAGKVFTDEFLATLAKVKVIRGLDWCQANTTNNLTQGLDFTKRPTPSTRRTTWNYSEDPTRTTAKKQGHAYETLIALSNITGADLWLCLPFNASDAYITALASLLLSSLTAGQRLIVERSNEAWNFNGGFEQYDVLQGKVAAELNGWVDMTARTSGQNTRFITGVSRSAGIVTVGLSTPPTGLAAGSFVRYANIDGVFNTTTVQLTAVGANSVSFAKAGPDGAFIGGQPTAVGTYNNGSFLYDAATTSNLVAGAGTSQSLLDARFIWMTRSAKGISDIFRSVWGDSNMRTRVLPVYCWQSAGTDFDRELRWLKTTFPDHDPGYYVPAVGHAPYFSLDGTPVGLPNLAGDTNLSLVVGDYTTVLVGTAKVAKRRYFYEEKAASCVHYSTVAEPIELLCYEGGPDTSTLDGDVPDGHANNTKKSAANLDPAFQPAMEDFYRDVIRFGTNNSIPSQFWVGEFEAASPLKVDRWGTTDDISNRARPKQAAIEAVAGAARPARTRRSGPGTYDMRLRAGQYTDIDPNITVSGLFPWLITSDINFNTQSVTLTWEETATTPQTRTYSFVYTCNFDGWACHVDINGVRVGTSVALTKGDTLPNPPTTERTIGPFTFTSRPGLNAIRIVRAGGGSGRDGQLRRDTIA